MDIIQHTFNLIKRGQVEEALNKTYILAKENKDNPIIFNLLGLVYIKKKKLDNAINNFKKAIELKKEYPEPYYNIGQILFQLGKFNQAEIYLKKAIQYKSKYLNALYLLGENYLYLGEYDKAAYLFSEVLDINPHHSDAFTRILEVLTLSKKKIEIENYIVLSDQKLKEINLHIDLNEKISNQILNIFFKDLFKILPQKLLSHESLNTQIIKNNENNLNCLRHFQVVKNYKVIPENCFSCFKLQVETKNVLELIKLYLLLNNIDFPNNNHRKCFIELRENIPGTYKALVYCSNIFELESIDTFLTPILKKALYEDIKITQKRGCSEFSNIHPEYKNLDKDKMMIYNSEWKKFENSIDEKIPQSEKSHERVYSENIKNLCLSDILVILNWIRYAKNINDFSYKKILDDEQDIGISNYFNLNTSSQFQLRSDEHLKSNK